MQEERRGGRTRGEDRQGETEGKSRNEREETPCISSVVVGKTTQRSLFATCGGRGQPWTLLQSLLRSISLSRPLGTLIELVGADVYALVEPNLMNAQLHESVNGKRGLAFAASSFSSRRRNVFRRDAGKISRPRFQTIVVSGFGRSVFVDFGPAR